MTYFSEHDNTNLAHTVDIDSSFSKAAAFLLLFMVRGRKRSRYFYHVPNPHTQPLFQVAVLETRAVAAWKVGRVFSGSEF